jgi:hypothetical protein
MPGSPLVSARGAARVLEGVGVGRRRARELLTAGLAGRPTVTNSEHLYEVALVQRLAEWPHLRAAELDALCPAGVFIARRRVHVDWSDAERDAAVSSGWLLSPWTLVWLVTRIKQHGAVPLVATLCGFVVHGAEIVDARVADAEQRPCQLTLRRPGLWFDEVRNHRFTSPAGASWTLRGWPPPPAAPAA